MDVETLRDAIIVFVDMHNTVNSEIQVEDEPLQTYTTIDVDVDVDVNLARDGDESNDESIMGKLSKITPISWTVNVSSYSPPVTDAEVSSSDPDVKQENSSQWQIKSYEGEPDDFGNEPRSVSDEPKIGIYVEESGNRQ
ncbi:hypothetical protein L1887_05333 [Cichorium endivia]|nr:hypothetical protein L1887_05333 [Cichorium endivia]